MNDWNLIRKNYPLVENTTYLNTPLLGAISRATHERGQGYMEELMYDGPLNYAAWDFELSQVREDAGKMINAAGKDIAFVGDVATGMNFLSYMLPQKGKEVVMYENDFPSVVLPWQNQAHKVVKIPASTHGVITPDFLKETFTANTGMLVLSVVQYNSGFRIDLEAIGQLCREKGVLFVVDATQALGAFTIDVAAQKIDVLLASTYKWVLGGYGSAIFYVNPELVGDHFPAVGWHSLNENIGIPDLSNVKKSISALEIGHSKFQNILVTGVALKELLALTVPAIEQRVASLTKTLHRRLRERGIKILSDYEGKNLSGITLIQGSAALVGELAKKQILCSYRGEGLRVGLHFYNNEADIDHLVSEL